MNRRTKWCRDCGTFKYPDGSVPVFVGKLCTNCHNKNGAKHRDFKWTQSKQSSTKMSFCKCKKNNSRNLRGRLLSVPVVYEAKMEYDVERSKYVVVVEDPMMYVMKPVVHVVVERPVVSSQRIILLRNGVMFLPNNPPGHRYKLAV